MQFGKMQISHPYSPGPRYGESAPSKHLPTATAPTGPSAAAPHGLILLAFFGSATSLLERAELRDLLNLCGLSLSHCVCVATTGLLIKQK